MKFHRDAKSTPTNRVIMVQRVLDEGWSYADAAEGGADGREVGPWIPGGRRRGARRRVVSAWRAGASDARRDGHPDPRPAVNRVASRVADQSRRRGAALDGRGVAAPVGPEPPTRGRPPAGEAL